MEISECYACGWKGRPSNVREDFERTPEGFLYPVGHVCPRCGENSCLDPRPATCGEALELGWADLGDVIIDEAGKPILRAFLSLWEWVKLAGIVLMLFGWLVVFVFVELCTRERK